MVRSFFVSVRLVIEISGKLYYKYAFLLNRDRESSSEAGWPSCNSGDLIHWRVNTAGAEPAGIKIKG